MDLTAGALRVRGAVTNLGNILLKGT
jgi:hypothetical protein